jgi:NADPH:quinone reductase-like Zn-dependent oxidoreductase
MATATTQATFRCYELDEFGIQSLAIKNRQATELKPYEVLVMVHAVSLNYRDLMMVLGRYNPKMKRPFTPCSDGAGTVLEVGSEVKRFKAGDRVMGAFMPDWTGGRLSEDSGRSALGGGGTGMLAEQVALPEHGLVRIPDHLSFEEAATLPCAAVTAWNALIESGNLRPGETVLTLGTGGVSVFAIQIALMTGCDVIATSGSDEKLARLKEMGVTKTINYKTTPDWSAEVLKLTGKRGVDHVVEVGGAGTLDQSLKSTAPAGHVAVIGVLSGVQTDLNPRLILMKNLRVQGIFVGSREMFENMNRAIDLHKLKPVVDKVFPFEQAADAWKWMESGSHFGKIVINVSK